MTPKEKAKQLKNKFYNKEVENKIGSFEADIDATERALICVDEIIEAVRHIVGEKLRTEYYLEVKQEIEKL